MLGNLVFKYYKMKTTEQVITMPRIGDKTPDFKAVTTKGRSQ